MANCPTCGEGINYLRLFQRAGHEYMFDGVDCKEVGSFDYDEYVCPECDMVLFLTRNRAAEFLAGGEG